MNDILPEEQPWWDKVRKTAKETAEAFGFSRIDTPIVEDVDIFIKGTGASTDIVQKQMYILRSKKSQVLALRPEATPGVARAYLEHGLFSLAQPVKLWYLGPMFRYERPQAGRLRQFYQFGTEIIGDKDPVLDAQTIQLGFCFLRSLGLKKVSLQLNSLGCSICRTIFRRTLVDYYRSKKNRICKDCKRRLKENPLRLLDCKQDKCQPVISQAPVIIDSLCDECRAHFKSVLEYLDELDLPYFLNHHLVRGLDYYTKTVFEFFPGQEPALAKQRKDKTPAALGGGGRYDGLLKIFSGKEAPAVGISFGLERVINLMKQLGLRPNNKARASVFLVQLGGLAKRRALRLFDELKKAGICVSESFSKESIAAQLKMADKARIGLVLILGQQEVIDESIIIRDMVTGIQETVPFSKVVKEVKKRLRNK